VVKALAFLSLLAGFATMAAIVMVVTALLRWLVPEWTRVERRPSVGYVIVNLGYSFLAAALGGYVTAWAAGMNPLPSVLGLAVAVLALGAISALQARGRQARMVSVGVADPCPSGGLGGRIGAVESGGNTLSLRRHAGHARPAGVILKIGRRA
jgi:hypothetical protein